MSGPWQTVLSRGLAVNPDVPVGSFQDYWGNVVEYFAIPFRHPSLEIASTSVVETAPQDSVEYCEDITIAEARQILAKSSLQLLDYRRPTRLVPLGAVLRPLEQEFYRGNAPLVETVLFINSWLHSNFEYVPGATAVTTPLESVIQMRKGVCQDFAHTMLSILRTAGIPARYVSGYIEPIDPTIPNSELVGAAASHAWIEVNLPGNRWWGLDPTNNQIAGDRHIKVASGRDYHDIAPFRGTFRGLLEQNLEVTVQIDRI